MSLSQSTRLPNKRCSGVSVLIEVMQRICPQPVSNDEHQSPCWGRQRRKLGSHPVNQRGCKVNVKDGGEEHNMDKQSHNKEEQHIQGN